MYFGGEAGWRGLIRERSPAGMPARERTGTYWNNLEIDLPNRTTFLYHECDTDNR